MSLQEGEYLVDEIHTADVFGRRQELCSSLFLKSDNFYVPQMTRT